MMDEKDKIIAELRATIKVLLARIAELERLLGLDSSNSGKPPSSDGLRKKPSQKKPRTSSLRESGKKPSGGQVGHKGKTLEQSSTPDKIIRHQALAECSHCSHSLKSEPVIETIKRQVFDIPEPKIEITEHQSEVKICPCCHKKQVAPFPANVQAPTQYGKNIQSIVVYLRTQHFIPEDRLQEIFCDLFGLPLSTASLAKFIQNFSEKLIDFEQDVFEKIAQASVKHADETGFRVAGKTWWLHVYSTFYLTYYFVSPKRKALVEELIGTLVHDHWTCYFQLPNVSHALCNQHHLRELKALIEHEKEPWARNMHRFLRFALYYTHHYDGKEIPAHTLRKLFRLYDKIVEEGLRYHQALPPFETLRKSKKKAGRSAKRIGHNLVLRLKNYRTEVLRFLTNPLVPFTNNQAERDIRMMKCQQKISGSFRTETGAQTFARVRGFLSTCKKQGLNLLDAIKTIQQGGKIKLVT